MNQPKILIVGSANIDLVAGVPRIPKSGETLMGTTFATVPGGKGANQAVAAARLGAKTYFAGCIGADAFGEMQRQTFSEAGIDTTYLKTHPSEPTGTAVILVGDDGQNSIVVIPSANSGILPSDVAALEPLFANLDAVLVQLEIPLETVEAVFDLAHRTGVLSILDAGPARPLSPDILRKADIVSPNESEVEAITGVAVTTLDDAKRAAARLREMGAREVVLKLGANGAYYLGDESFHVPPYPIEPVDTTAAGDAFTAALGFAWKSLPRQQAIQFANATGALAATVAGAQPSMPTFAAVRDFLRQRGEHFVD